MKNGVFYILVCMLMIATAVPTLESSKNTTIDRMPPHHLIRNMSGNWTETQKLLALDGDTGDGFGCFLSLSGDTALIGAFWDDDNGVDSGSAYVFTRNDTTWIQQAKLLASDGAAGDNLGSFVSLDGDTALIGAFYDDDNGFDSGSAYVFIRTGTTWTQQAKLLASDGAAGDWFGRCVSLDGDTAIIGAPNHDDTGSAYVFTRTGTIWTQQAELLASDGAAGDWFGPVALSGDTALIGAFYDDDNGDDSGSAYVFTRSGTTWTQQAKLLASDGGAQDFFGWSVFLREDIALVGAGEVGHDTGSAYVFTRTGTIWTQQAKLLASDGTAGDHFGVTVSLSGDTALIGAPYHDGTGSAYVFTRTDTSWTQQAKLRASDGAGGDWFGYSVSLDGDTALINAPLKDGTGSAYLFVRGNQQPIADFTWTPQNPPPGQTITFDASASHDPGGYITLYEWDWNNDGSYNESHSSPIATHSWPQVGNYPITLRITDNDNATDTVTKIVTVANQPPNKPTIHGETSGEAKIAYQWNFTSTDPDNDDVSYQIDWGDGTLSPWYGPHNSGEPINQSHAYDYEGTYTIKAIAKDVYGNYSDWGTLSVVMPYNIPFIQFWKMLFERFPNAFPILRHLLGY